MSDALKDIDELELLCRQAPLTVTEYYDDADVAFLHAANEMVPKLIKLARAYRDYLQSEVQDYPATTEHLINCYGEVFGDDA